MDVVERIRAYYAATLPYYDASLEDRGDLPFWESLATRWDSKCILELGCGTGRVTQVLARRATVTAVDLLMEMLQHVPARAPNALLVAADLRCFAFTTKFDLIVIAGDPMAHLTSSGDRAKVMRLIADHLIQGGRVVIEGLYRWRPSRAIHRGVEEWWQPAGEDSIWNATYRYTEGSSTVEVKSTLRSWTRSEADRLQEFGFHVEHIWGDFNEDPFDERSPRIVIVAKRL